MGRQRSDVDEQVSQLLRTAKTALRMRATFLTRMDGTSQHLEVDLGQGWYFGRPGPAASLDGGAPEPAPETEGPPVVVPQQRASGARASRWTPWAASRGRRRAESAAGSYPGV